jgi:hypothetical protein
VTEPIVPQEADAQAVQLLGTKKQVWPEGQLEHSGEMSGQGMQRGKS